MNITIEIEDALLTDVDLAAAVKEISRQEAFAEALTTWAAHRPKHSGWSIDWSTWEGDPDAPDYGEIRKEQWCEVCPRRLNPAE